MNSFWQYYVFFGLLIMIMELFSPTFFLLPIGIGVMFSGIFTFWIDDRTSMHFVTAICIVISVVLMRRFFKTSKSGLPTPMEDIIGKEIQLECDLKAGVRASGKIYGESWTVIAENESEEFSTGDIAIIVKVVGKKLVIKKR